MPVEGQSRAPLRRRDVILLVVLGLAALGGGIAAGVTSLTSPHHSARHCLVVDLPSTVGGAHLTRCGADAKSFCRTESRHDRIVAEACRRQGFAAG